MHPDRVLLRTRGTCLERLVASTRCRESAPRRRQRTSGSSKGAPSATRDGSIDFKSAQPGCRPMIRQSFQWDRAGSLLPNFVKSARGRFSFPSLLTTLMCLLIRNRRQKH